MISEFRENFFDFREKVGDFFRRIKVRRRVDPRRHVCSSVALKKC